MAQTHSPHLAQDELHGLLAALDGTSTNLETALREAVSCARAKHVTPSNLQAQLQDLGIHTTDAVIAWLHTEFLKDA